ncbi:MAG TPA: hypothetical protein VH500_14520 [Nitrososphaeraceae archaeon]|jgi:hypothetical protein
MLHGISYCPKLFLDRIPKKKRMSIPTREIKDYGILVYVSPEGYQTNRSQISLYGADGKTIAFLRFNDPGMFFENDSLLGDIILMHLPSSIFQSVLDILRNESPVYIYWAQNRGFLSTSSEPVGEGEGYDLRT